LIHFVLTAEKNEKCLIVAMTNLSEQILLILAKWQNMARKSYRHNQKLLTAPRSYGKIILDDGKKSIEMKKQFMFNRGQGSTLPLHKLNSYPRGIHGY